MQAAADSQMTVLGCIGYDWTQAHTQYKAHRTSIAGSWENCSFHRGPCLHHMNRNQDNQCLMTCKPDRGDVREFDV